MKMLLAVFLGLSLYPIAATALPPPPPLTLVIIACRVTLTGEEEKSTGWVGLDWYTKDAELQCKREIVPLEDAAVLNGAKPLPHNLADYAQCAKAAMMFTPDWNKAHKGWAVMKVGCPVPVVDGAGNILSWHLPECPNGIRCRFDESLI